MLGKYAFSLVQILSFGAIVIWLGQNQPEWHLLYSSYHSFLLLSFLFPGSFWIFQYFPSQCFIGIAETVGFIFSSQWEGKAIPNWNPGQIGGPNNLSEAFSSLKRTPTGSAFLFVDRMVQFGERMYIHSPSEKIAYI